MTDDRLSISVQHADGRVTRWGYDELDGARIPQDLQFGTSIPGGFSTLQCNLLRRLDKAHADQDLYDTITVYGPGGRIAWEGTTQQFPRSHADTFNISPGAVGWQADLMRDRAFREVYVDRNMGWGGTPLARRLEIAAASISQGDMAWQRDGDSLVLPYPNQALGAQTLAEVAYKAPAGVTIASVQYQGAHTSPPASWVVALDAADTEILSGAERYTPNLDNTLRTITLSPARRNLFLFIWSNGTASTPSAGALSRVTDLALYGDHGLTLRAITGEPDGVYASDVIADVVSRAAPLLNFTTGTSGSIEPRTFAIPHLAFHEPTTAEQAINQVNAYELCEWGVYDDREFFFRQPDPDRLCWEARLADGAHMQADGLTAAQVYNGAYVQFTDPTGQQQSVGPPGGSFDATDAALEDTSESNPWNAHFGGTANWLPLSLSYPTTPAGAIQIGTVALAEASLLPYRGTVTLTGSVRHPTEGPVPVWRVRAGDWIRVTDLDDENATVQRKVIGTSYNHAARTITLDLDQTPAKLSAILARVGIHAGIATGGGF